MWNRWRGKLAGEGLLRRANQTVTDRAAGRTDHREASGGVAAAFHDVCSGVPTGQREDLATSFPCHSHRNFGGVRWTPVRLGERGDAEQPQAAAGSVCGLLGLDHLLARCIVPSPPSEICGFCLSSVA